MKFLGLGAPAVVRLVLRKKPLILRCRRFCVYYYIYNFIRKPLRSSLSSSLHKPLEFPYVRQAAGKGILCPFDHPAAAMSARGRNRKAGVQIIFGPGEARPLFLELGTR